MYSLIDDDEEPSILRSSGATGHTAVVSTFHVAKKTKQTSIDPHLVPLVKESVAHCLAECFAVHHVPFSLVGSDLFKKCLLAFRQSSHPVPPTRKELAAQVFDNVRAMKPVVINRLQASSGVTVGMDGWTNVRREKVINLVPVADGVAFYWDSVVLKQRSTAVAQLPLISAALQSIINEGVVVVGLSFDNESVNFTLFQLLLRNFRFLIHVPCAAHTIQLCVKSVLALPAVADALQGMDALLHAFDSSKILRFALLQLQETLRPGKTPVKTLPYNATRWSSRLRAVQRTLLLKTCIVAMRDRIVAQLRSLKRVSLHRFSFDDDWWRMMSAIESILIPYQVATDVVQSDSSCLMDVWHQFLQLSAEAEKLVAPHLLAALRVPINDILRLQWYGDNRSHRSHVNRFAIIMCAVFSFDATYDRLFPSEDLTAANEWFRQWAVEFVLHYNLSEEKDRQSIEQTIFNQYSDFTSKRGAFLPIDEWLRLTRQQRAPSPSARHIRWDPRAVWHMTKKTARELTACALALLSLTASEAAVERTFSKQGLIHSKLRNSLSSESVQAQMFIAFNYRALHRQEEDEPQGAWVDISEDIETRPRARGIFLHRLPNDALLPLPDDTVPPADLLVQDDQGAAAAGDEDDEEEGGKEEKKQEEQEEDDDEEDADHEEAKQEDSPALRLHNFVRKMVRDWTITRKFRFTSDLDNALSKRRDDAGLGHLTVEHLKAHIRHHLSVCPDDA
jgi:hypothetical protein